MNEKLFVIPFVAGMALLFIILIVKGYKWISSLSKIDRLRLINALKSRRILQSAKDIFMECLIHRRIFKKNMVLGYMHMSLAFGWFLLIVVGHLEAFVAEKSLAVPFYLPIFFRFFETGKEFAGSKIFAALMDLLLLFVLSGVVLAWSKRFYKRLFGMRRTTRLQYGDQIAMTALWLIFPLRLLAESATAHQFNNGSFITQTAGSLFFNSNTASTLALPLWAAYSLALGSFFVALPYSRYMHIPTEMLFIIFKNAGIKLKKRTNSFTELAIYSCSRCGICLDNCQLNNAGIKNTQSVYVLKSIRNKNIDDEQLFNCLLCGKCQVDCPVGIDLTSLRITQRIESTLQYNASYAYLENQATTKAGLIYFAGCMTHLTPRIIQSMQHLFELAGEDYWFLDKEKAPCCGRPLMLAGQYDAAAKLIRNNTTQIIASGAKKLVVSCPICYKVFKEDYQLPGVEVLFHAEYILRLMNAGLLKTAPLQKRIIYHDPCELGRGSGMYEIPREVVKNSGQLIRIKNEQEHSLCCGGSLGNLKISQAERNLIRDSAINEYLSYQPEYLVTACPLCKKTFARNRNMVVMDLAELVLEASDEFIKRKKLKGNKVTNIRELETLIQS
ncbi:MAG: (Fe-S)-binding protein [Prolixibacteraceae bacterium]|nr:(Fe-S)-binding protein [Prolixibacteraceae bacterium]